VYRDELARSRRPVAPVSLSSLILRLRSKAATNSLDLVAPSLPSHSRSKAATTPSAYLTPTTATVDVEDSFRRRAKKKGTPRSYDNLQVLPRRPRTSVAARASKERLAPTTTFNLPGGPHPLRDSNESFRLPRRPRTSCDDFTTSSIVRKKKQPRRRLHLVKNKRRRLHNAFLLNLLERTSGDDFTFRLRRPAYLRRTLSY
jgi:hypothetical protein